MDVTDLPLPSRSNAPVETQDAVISMSATPFAEPPTIAAPKSSAQRQREYRQRLAVSRTPAQWAVTRISDTERKRNYRLRKNAANLALVSVSLESTTASSSCSAERSNDVQNTTQQQLINQQCQSLKAEPAQTTVQPGTPFAEPQTVTAPKSSAQRQREYRQRLAVSRTPAQWAATRISETERKRKYRLRKAAMLALASDSLESSTASSSRSAGNSDYVQNSTQRFTNQQVTKQLQSLAAGPAQTTVQLATPFAVPPTIAAPKSSAQTKSEIETSRATMADNIVIEEHDILDHPHIKKLFPDIANLKTEVIFDKDDEELETKPKYIEVEIPNFCQNKIIKTSPCHSDSSLEDEDEKVSKLLPTDVVLENWGIILADSQRYCNTCELLFPSKNELDFHNMTRHMYPKAVKNEPTENKIEITIFKTEPDLDTSDYNLCKHCNVVFPDELALLKHFHEFLPKEFACEFCDLAPLTGIPCKLHNIEHTQAKYYRCPICSCSYKFMYKLRRHMADCHHTRLPKSVSLVLCNYECVFCVARFENNKKYNEHIMYCHREMFHKTVHNNESDKCLMCKMQSPC